MRLSIPQTNDDSGIVRGVRVGAWVESGRVRCRRQELWFAVPREYGERLATRGDSWLLALLPFAMALGEPLEVPLPVDSVLLANVGRLQDLWVGWQPRLLRQVEVRAVPVELRQETAPSRGASFFTAGIDSMLAALYPDWPDQRFGGNRGDGLVHVLGFQTSLSSLHETGLIESLRMAASGMGYPLEVIGTNVRELNFANLPWGAVYHGFALGAVAQILAGRYGLVRIGSSHSPPQLQPWGSHPKSDPLLSSSGLKVVHHGADLGRLDKLRILAQRPDLIDQLRICFLEESGGNCSRCGKCLRVMAGLDLLGCLGGVRAFNPAFYDIAKLRRLLLDSGRSFVGQLLSEARSQGRTDIQEALEETIRWNDRNQRVLARFGRLGWIPILGPMVRSIQRKVRRRLCAQGVH